MSANYPDTKRTMWLTLDRQALHMILGLPEGVSIAGLVAADMDPMRMRVLLASPQFPEVPAEAESPLLHPYVSAYDTPHGTGVEVNWSRTMHDVEEM